MATFEDYESTRKALLGVHDQILAVWNDFTTSRSPLDAISTTEASEDAVRTELSEARARLDHALIEVGVFGDIKRGKSTLLNALLGAEVSSMDVLPETAVPVYVEAGRRSATVFFQDGRHEDVEPDAAVHLATQTYLQEIKTRRENSTTEESSRVVRVVQRLEAELLRPGVRLIDTPGLSDPSMSDVFEQLTLAELDRTAAAVIVFLYPPGIASNEIELLSTLDARRVAKTFLVCNFYSGPWEDGSIRERVEAGIREAIARGAGAQNAEDLHLFAVNAGAAWEARRTGDVDAYERSGVAQLARSLEDYLTTGALTLLAENAGLHLRRAQQIAAARIQDRIDVLSDPNRLDGVRASKERVVADAKKRSEAICARISREAELLGSRVAEIAKEPYEQALAELGDVRSLHDLKMLESRLNVLVETANSRGALAFSEVLEELGTQAQAAIVEMFHEDEDLADGLSVVRPAGAEPSPVLSAAFGETDWGKTAIAAAVGGIGGGMIAGGAGIALLWFLGPIGWALGAVFGALIATGVVDLRRRALTSDGRRQVRDQLQAAMLKAQDRAREGTRRAGMAFADRVRTLHEEYTRDSRAELLAVERFVQNDGERSAQISVAAALRDRLSAARV